MNTTTVITRALLAQLKTEIDAAIKTVGDRHGIDLKAGNASFSDSNFALKIEGVVKGGETGEAQTFLRNATRFGLSNDDLGKTIKLRGRGYTITGMNRGGSILANRDDGKGFRIPVEIAVAQLKMATGHA